MSLMQWNEHFATGIEVIDEQHRWLIDLVNASAPILALNYERHQERANELLDQLMAYAGFHFKTEDQLMEGYRIDPRHELHHQESHARFAAEVTRMRAAYTSGNAPTGAELLTFLANWLIYHILGEDQALARQIRAIEAGKTPAEAYDLGQGDQRDPTHEALTQALIDAYKLMVEQNRNLIENNRELEKHRNRLEDLVSERTAELVRALDAAQTANKARNTFIANMSHEIRTPMNAIVGLTWALKKGTTDSAQLARLNQVAEATEQLLSIVNDLLDMARIESELLTLEPLDFNLSKVVHEILGSIADKAAAKGLHVTLDLPEDLPLLRGDPIRLGQILSNYADNAVKFTDKGSVALRVRLLESPDGSQDLVRLRFEIEDSGIGIAPELIPHLFQPFVQADDSLTRRHRGAGLGLAISHHLAEMMGGITGIESTQGKGSLFWLELPFGIAAGNAASPKAIGSHPHEDSTGCRSCPQGNGQAQEVLLRIASLLADDDVHAITLWHESRDILEAHLGDRFRIFEAALMAYDFAAAHAQLSQMLDYPAADQR